MLQAGRWNTRAFPSSTIRSSYDTTNVNPLSLTLFPSPRHSGSASRLRNTCSAESVWPTYSISNWHCLRSRAVVVRALQALTSICSRAAMQASCQSSSPSALQDLTNCPTAQAHASASYPSSVQHDISSIAARVLIKLLYCACRLCTLFFLWHACKGQQLLFASQRLYKRLVVGSLKIPSRTLSAWAQRCFIHQWNSCKQYGQWDMKLHHTACAASSFDMQLHLWDSGKYLGQQ